MANGSRCAAAGFRLRLAVGVLGVLWAAGSAPGASLVLEDFDPTAAGWTDRDAGEMTVSHDAGNDWMVGTFASQVFPLPQTDAFMVNTGTDFLGDYVTPGLTQIAFDLYADDVLPSDLFIRLIDGANTFSYQFSLGAMAVDAWSSFTVNLVWSAGWIGPSQSAFNTALTSVDQVEIQLSRNGIGAQTFYLDNVETLDTPLSGAGAVPEPATGQMILQGVVMVLALRRRIRQAV